MRRAVVVGLVAMLTLIVAGSVATADNHLPEHPHLLVLGAEVDFSGEEPVLVGAHKCIDLANNNALRLNAQHAHMHFGTAGEALATHADSFVVPAAPFPFVPWANCAEFLEFFGVSEG